MSNPTHKCKVSPLRGHPEHVFKQIMVPSHSPRLKEHQRLLPYRLRTITVSPRSTCRCWCSSRNTTHSLVVEYLLRYAHTLGTSRAWWLCPRGLARIGRPLSGCVKCDSWSSWSRSFPKDILVLVIAPPLLDLSHTRRDIRTIIIRTVVWKGLRRRRRNDVGTRRRLPRKGRLRRHDLAQLSPPFVGFGVVFPAPLFSSPTGRST